MKKFFLALLFLPLPVLAVDGVFEINQVCANGFGCFDGDNSGFPVTIDSPGSYRLTSNLDVSGLSTPENRTAIDVNTDNVTIDLNGFSIIGPVSCTGTPVTSCTPTGGNGDGIQTSSSTSAFVFIKNGTIRGMGNNAIDCARNCNITNVTAIQNDSTAFSNANGESIFRHNIALRNGGDGFFVSGLVEGNTAIGNGDDGIFTNPGSRVISNQSEDNAADGIRCFTCSLINNVVRSNEGFGIDYGSGRTVAGGNLIDNNTLGEFTGTAPFEIAPNRCGFVAC